MWVEIFHDRIIKARILIFESYFQLWDNLLNLSQIKYLVINFNIFFLARWDRINDFQTNNLVEIQSKFINMYWVFHWKTKKKHYSSNSKQGLYAPVCKLVVLYLHLKEWTKPECMKMMSITLEQRQTIWVHTYWHNILFCFCNIFRNILCKYCLYTENEIL